MGGRDAVLRVSAVVFDWAGTVLDFGSLAPLSAFQALFAQWGVPISVDEAREPMGLPKRAHIEAIAAQHRVSLAWQARHGGAPTAAEIDAMYAAYTPMNIASVAQHARLIPGTLGLMQQLRERGLRIGSTTGYPRAVMEVLAPLAAAQGFAPDSLVCTDDVAVGRPAPLAMYRSFVELGVWPAAAVVKVDDTVPGLLEGQAAGCWTVAVTDTGNAVGVSESTWGALPEPARAAMREQAQHQLAFAQPDFTIASVVELLPVLDAIDCRLAAGQLPRGARGT